MKLLSVKLKNCYGIPSFEDEFDFNKSNANLIYAPNGVMKTSFAKTFLQISKGLLPEEKIHNNTSTFEILFDGDPISPDEILVIEPFIPDYESKNISTLLVNSEKKERYDQIYKD
ncbi:MAG: phage infection protein, partial [Candidatus Paceibacterota bacterium]